MDQGLFIDLNLYGTSTEDNIITNPLHLFFQEIELSVKIGPGQLWGVRDSIELSKYLFNQYITASRIKTEITTYIAMYCPNAQNFQYEIDVKILNIENKDLIYIVVKVYSENENQEFIQKFLLGE